MQIRIEIDVKPEELRRFLGLPDVAGLQEDLISFLRDKLGSAAENFDPASFVKDNLQTLRQSAPWQLLVSAKARTAGAAAAAPEKAAPRRSRKRKSKRSDDAAAPKPTARRKAAKRSSTPPPADNDTE